MKNLRKLRINAGISQQKLADLLGCSQQSMHKYENGISQPDIDTIVRIARYFNTSVDYLVGNSDIPEILEKREPYELSIHEAEYYEKIRHLSKKHREAVEALIDHLL